MQTESELIAEYDSIAMAIENLQFAIGGLEGEDKSIKQIELNFLKGKFREVEQKLVRAEDTSITQNKKQSVIKTITQIIKQLETAGPPFSGSQNYIDNHAIYGFVVKDLRDAFEVGTSQAHKYLRDPSSNFNAEELIARLKAALIQLQNGLIKNYPLLKNELHTVFEDLRDLANKD